MLYLRRRLRDIRSQAFDCASGLERVCVGRERAVRYFQVCVREIISSSYILGEGAWQIYAIEQTSIITPSTKSRQVKTTGVGTDQAVLVERCQVLVAWVRNPADSRKRTLAGAWMSLFIFFLVFDKSTFFPRLRFFQRRNVRFQNRFADRNRF